MAFVATAYGPGGQDGFSWTGATSNTAGPYTLNSGKYAFAYTAPGTSCLLEVLSPDGSTYIALNAAATTAAYAVYDLPAGVYQVVVTSVSAVAGFVARIRHHGA